MSVVSSDAKEGDTQDGAFFRFGLALGRSRLGMSVLAVSVAALFCGLAYTVYWHARDLALHLLVLSLLVYGFRSAWNLLPFSLATRARLEREEEIAGRCRAAPCRDLLGLGIGLGVLNFLTAEGSGPVGYFMPACFAAVGLVSHFLCWRFVRKASAS